MRMRARDRTWLTEGEILYGCIGQEITVYYLGESSGVASSDSGVLIETDGSFLRLGRRNDTDLLIPLSAIRIIKTKARSTDNCRTLPRAVGALPENRDKEKVP